MCDQFATSRDHEFFGVGYVATGRTCDQACEVFFLARLCVSVV